MKLTAELLAQQASAPNALKDRELDLRGLKVGMIENLGVTRDQNDAIDFTDNDIRYLGNFPHMPRLRHLLLSNNLVSRVDPHLHRALPYLVSLVLTNNAVAEFRQIVHLRQLRHLEFLSLLDNPVSRQEHYRAFVVWRLPSVRVLDFRRVTAKDREHAQRLFATSDGRPSELAVQLSGTAAAVSAPRTNGAHAFVPGEARPGKAGRLLSADDRVVIAAAIEKSQSLEEIRRLEEQLKMGFIPEV
ncbi:U2 snRNP complex subunit [Malassezia sp. CBS 17886]|nr:U2 snRNP complex subunit [Malassezia sp. CBS 17886]